MKTVTEIAANCGLKPVEERLLTRILNNTIYPAGSFQQEIFDVIRALYRRVSAFEASEEFREKMGIKTEDAKWLDPECHSGCQSLVLKHRIEALDASKTQMSINFNWLMAIVDRIHLALCPSHIGTWQQRAESAAAAAIVVAGQLQDWRQIAGPALMERIKSKGESTEGER